MNENGTKQPSTLKINMLVDCLKITTLVHTNSDLYPKVFIQAVNNNLRYALRSLDESLSGYDSDPALNAMVHNIMVDDPARHALVGLIKMMKASSGVDLRQMSEETITELLVHILNGSEEQETQGL